MEVVNTGNNSYNYTDTTRQLFDAMLAGKTIKSITCMKGSINKNNPERDFTLTNVKALHYWVGMGWSEASGNVDLVDIEPQQFDAESGCARDSFYMNWVRSFEI